ncbi:AcrR family transcriptional regulator [Allocatelliglobosispora scoriae]|uniref:AcrR family transcriptional regulator n=1 Tax=Allocatelliglobosispora scoriae TaxID=643052 RepID=A0A841C1K3_9ACTN|nr:TetR family transcriptional regulator [Allocatelliglobosispora scoriae]MBB5872751.1 AcrR family transcriptional regulator [Allocatelliglobosispora scoriae]
MTLVEDAPALGRRDRKKQQTRAALIQAALRLADERGLENITVEEISEAADVSSRTFFNYFSSKDDAIIGDHQADAPPLHELFAALPADIPVIGALRLALAPVIAQVQADQELWFLRMRVLAEHPALLPRLHANGAAAERDLTAAVAARTGVGPDHVFPPLIVGAVGVAVRTSMARWAACGGARPLAELLDEAFVALAGGLMDPR